MADAAGRRIGRTAIAALAGMAMLLSLFSLNPLSGAATRQAGQVTLGAVTIYAALRTLNLFLSAAQEIEVGGSFVVSGSVQPLKMLEPIDDTVENVAGMILGISVVSGLLAISFGPLSAIGFALIAAAMLLAARAPPLSRQMTTTGAMMALIVPLVFALSGLFADAVTGAVWDRNAEILEGIADRIDDSDALAETRDPATAPAGENEGFLGSLWRSGAENAAAVGDATTAVVDALAAYREAGAYLVENADALLRSYIEILAVLLFKTVLLPGVLILVSFRMLR
jgi:hypothetical protein